VPLKAALCRIFGARMRSYSSTPRSGAVKNSKDADLFDCKSLKTNDRNFAKTYFLTAPHARGYTGAGAPRLVRRISHGRFQIRVPLISSAEGAALQIPGILEVCASPRQIRGFT